MDKEKPIAIAFSDLHLHDWKSYSKDHNRLQHGLKAFQKIITAAREYNVPLLFAGDLFHNAKQLDNLVIARTFPFIQQQTGKLLSKFYGISGNHDQDGKNTLDQKAHSYVQTLADICGNFYRLDHMSPQDTGEFVVYGIPYLTHNIGFEDKVKEYRDHAKKQRKPTILLIHTDLHGAVNASEYAIDSVQGIPKDMDKFFEGFSLVLSGHIHIPQRLGKNIYMLGAPLQQTWGDANVEMGYWLIYATRKPRFVKLNLPQFIRLAPGETPPDAVNFYEQSQDTGGKSGEGVRQIGGFSKAESKSNLAKNYLKEKGIKSKARKKLLVKFLKEID